MENRAMAHAYTPGLRIAECTKISKRRLLPIPGEVLVEEGDEVTSSTVVAKTHLPGKVHTVNVVNALGISPGDIKNYMSKKEGEWVEEGEAIAENRPLIKWFKTQVKSPIRGMVENISDLTGQVLLREPSKPLELKAYIDGTVTEVFAGQGVTVDTICTFIQGIFGIGGESEGILDMANQSPEEILTADIIKEEHKGRVLVGGSLLEKEAFRRATAVGVKGVIVGGVNDEDLKEFMKCDIGIGITGTEDVEFTLIITEGFGKIAMAKKTFELLASKAGKKASLNGTTQIRAGVIRPEIIIPLEFNSSCWSQPSPNPGEEGLKVGNIIRIIREPFFGVIAKVKQLPAQPQLIPTGSKVRVLVAELPDGTTLVIPRANVEVIEE